jgi:aquaporin Z
MSRKLVAEFLGTFWLVFGGCGSAVLAATVVTDADFPAGIGFLGVSFAFGLTVLTGAYAFGHISGGHFNPAVTLGLFTAGKCETNEVVPYIVAQVIGGICGAGVLYLIANGVDGFSIDNELAGAFATNGFGDFSPGGYDLLAAFVIEVVLTFGFLLVIFGSTRKDIPAGFAPLGIGLALTLIHLISIPVTNTSVNPARSLGPAVFTGGTPLGQVWLFWVAPIIGAVLAGALYRGFLEHAEVEEEAEAATPG